MNNIDNNSPAFLFNKKIASSVHILERWMGRKYHHFRKWSIWRNLKLSNEDKCLMFYIQHWLWNGMRIPLCPRTNVSMSWKKNDKVVPHKLKGSLKWHDLTLSHILGCTTFHNQIFLYNVKFKMRWIYFHCSLAPFFGTCFITLFHVSGHSNFYNTYVHIIS